jgi:hypothetical protein
MDIIRARMADLPDVLALINDTRARLHARGVDQWPRVFTGEKFGPLVSRGEVYLVRDGGRAVAMAAVADQGDPAFWTPRELRADASYVSAMARAEGYAGTGALLLRWIGDAAYARGDVWVRLDARRDNAALHAYYAGQRFEYLRTVEVPGRYSGALFQRLALEDTEACDVFALSPSLPSRPPKPVTRDAWGAILPGVRVFAEMRGLGTVAAVSGPDFSAGAHGPAVPEYGRPPVTYEVALDDGTTVFAEEGDVTEMPAAVTVPALLAAEG